MARASVGTEAACGSRALKSSVTGAANVPTAAFIHLVGADAKSLQGKSSLGKFFCVGRKTEEDMPQYTLSTLNRTAKELDRISRIDKIRETTRRACS
ncbi:MAG: hypothetical protein M3371_10815 [Acidobacteriota bacterium]|nr:hypothetical protein [Acidobacteriota bacterium]